MSNNFDKDIYTVMQTKHSDNQRKEVVCEYELPDYINDISRVMLYDVDTEIVNYSQNNDTVAYEGRAVFYVILQSEDNGIGSINTECDFSGEFILNQGQCLDIGIKVENCSVKANNKRKLQIKCTVLIKPYIKEEISTNTNVQNNLYDSPIELLSSEIETATELRGVNSDIEFYKNIELDGNYPEIERLIICKVTPCIYDVKPAKDAVSVKGKVKTDVLYADANNMLVNLTYTDDLDECIQCPGANEKTVCKCTAKSNEINAQSETNAFGEEKNIEISAKSTIEVLCVENKNSKLNIDAFSPNYKIKTESKEITSTVCSDNISSNFSFNTSRDIKEFNEDIGYSVIYNDANVILNNITKNENGYLVFEGRLIYKAILKTNDKYEPISEEFPIKYESSVKCESDDIIPIADLYIISQSIKTDKNNIIFDAEISVNGIIMSNEKHNMISDIVFTDNKTENNSYISLYYVNGESLWEIAKANNTMTDKILSANDCDENEIELKKVIIIPNTKK